jgi:RES domain
LFELERFSSTDLDRWQQVSGDLNEFIESFYFGLEPARRRYRLKLLKALQSAGGITVVLKKWARIVTYQYSLQPLSCAGSLQSLGGRFNAGSELDDNTLFPWPALYVADGFETAFREKFQLASTELTQGLTPAELALEHTVSHSTVFMQGLVDNVFDMTTFATLNSVGKIFREIEPPKEVALLAKKLKIKEGTLIMIQTGAQLHHAVTKHNWRTWPMQFGMPAPSQLLAELIRAAGYEGILYPSSKGPGKCLAVFPDKLSDHSHIELVGPAPSEQTHVRLDANSAHQLEGWDSIPRNRRPL